MISDFKDLLEVLDAFGVRYLIVGGYAVMKYTEPRYTKDLDLWIQATPKNARAVFKALKEFGAPLANLTDLDIRSSLYRDPRHREAERILRARFPAVED